MTDLCLVKFGRELFKALCADDTRRMVGL